MSFSRRASVRVISFTAAAVLALGGWALQSRQQAALYRRQLEYSYLRSLQQLASSMSSISADLEKGSYAGTAPQLSTISTRLWREAGTAKTALTALPVGESHLDSTNLFLSQVGDYAMALSRKTAAGQELTDEEQQNLVTLLDHAKKLEEQVSRLEQSASSGELDASAIAARYIAQQNSGDGGQEAQGFEQDSYAEMEEGFEGYPRLIYDGPFSTHLTDREPAMLERLSNVSREAARNKAATAAGLELSKVSFDQDEHSNIPSYCFSGGDCTIGVTKQGGFVTYMINSRETNGQNLSVEQAEQSAKAYLRTLSYYNMESSYHEITNGICIFNFAYMQDDVTCYTDLIKVGVALDDGGVVLLDARGYLTNHQDRLLPAPSLTAAEAAGSVSGALEIQSSRMALIPSPGQNGVLCYEFSCIGREDQPVLVYVNARTGAEEQILMLIISEAGELTV